MVQSNRGKTDAIKELRLRRWARKNYVAPERRGDSWHPIVLEEMRVRDQERLTEPDEPYRGSHYVPLMPAGVRMIHQGHEKCADPKMLRHLVETERLVHGNMLQR